MLKETAEHSPAENRKCPSAAESNGTQPSRHQNWVSQETIFPQTGAGVLG